MNAEHYAIIILNAVRDADWKITSRYGDYIGKLHGHRAHPDSTTVMDLNTAEIILRELADKIAKRQEELVAKHNQLENA